MRENARKIKINKVNKPKTSLEVTTCQRPVGDLSPPCRRPKCGLSAVWMRPRCGLSADWVRAKKVARKGEIEISHLRALAGLSADRSFGRCDGDTQG